MARKHHPPNTKPAGESLKRSPRRSKASKASPESVSARKAETALKETGTPVGDYSGQAAETAPVEAEFAGRPEEPAETPAESPAETAEHAMAPAAEEAAEVREAAAGILPTLGKAIHRGVYSSFYCLTYGIVYGALTIGRRIPADNAMGEGVRDGAEAARKAYEGGLGRTVEPAGEGGLTAA
jgi:hypothetical protein